MDMIVHKARGDIRIEQWQVKTTGDWCTEIRVTGPSDEEIELTLYNSIRPALVFGGTKPDEIAVVVDKR